MDNVTHSLIGTALGAGFGRTLASQADRARGHAIWVAVVASNLPDADFVIPLFWGGGKILSLLHHRGYTHTLALAPVLAALALWVGSRIALGKGWRQEIPGLGGWFRAYALSILATLLHVGADYWNNYGVHPFLGHWYYGDFLFILEPILWCALLPYAIRIARKKRIRFALAFLGFSVLALAWTQKQFPLLVAMELSTLAVAGAAIQRKRPRLGGALAFAAGALAIFFATGRAARSHAERWLAEKAQGETVIGVGSAPAPGNPFCWRIHAATLQGATYRLREGSVGFLPGRMPPGECDFRRNFEPEAGTAQTEPGEPTGDPRLRWTRVFRADAAELGKILSVSECARAMTRFLRFPFWKAVGEGWVLGDLRYDFEAELGFAEVVVMPGDRCGFPLPGWTRPAEPLIRAAVATPIATPID